jgi:hypothetical protein
MVEAEGGTSGYGYPLYTVLSIFNSLDWWIDTRANIHVCADKSLFSSYQVGRAAFLLMGNRAHAFVRGVGTVDLKLTSGKTVQLKNVQHVPSIRKNLISGSLLFRDSYELVFESNKCDLSKFGTFIGKGYESGGLFRLSLCENNVKYVNHVNNHDEANVWHSRLCHINFGCMSRLVGLNLIPKFNLVKNSKCHVCVESPSRFIDQSPSRFIDQVFPFDLFLSSTSHVGHLLPNQGEQ